MAKTIESNSIVKMKQETKQRLIEECELKTLKTYVENLVKDTKKLKQRKVNLKENWEERKDRHHLKSQEITGRL
jgi:hypothetical protein